MVHYTVGIAGHIDHGKTTLAKALTGVDTDRLKEEKDREISIETGFAHFRLQNGLEVGVVDVPGHERFIRQMIAGSAGIDVVLLVVAANEGVMPQTREHLDILQLLGVKKGITVINKVDLVEEDFVQLVTDEVQELVQHTFLQHAPIIPVSAKTGIGIRELVAAITNTVAVVPERVYEEPFRLPIDRAFTVKGAGAVVTGTIYEGKVAVGDVLRLLPQNEPVRVRGLQVHHRAVDAAYAGQRTAINVTGVDYDRIRRGDVLVAPGYLEATQRIDFALHLLPSLDQSLRHRSRITAYSGTAEVNGIVLFFDRTELQPGETTYAQVVLDEPMVVKRGDPLLLRRPTPAWTWGGGEVVAPYARKHRFHPQTVAQLRQLHTATLSELVLHDVRQQEKSYLQLQNGLTVSWRELATVVQELVERGTLVLLTTGGQSPLDPVVAHAQHIADSKEQLLALLQKYHSDYPAQKGMKRSLCREQLSVWSDALFHWIVQSLVAEGTIQIDEERLVHADFIPQLPASLSARAEKALAMLRKEHFEVSDWATLATQAGLSAKEADEARRFYVHQGMLLDFGEKWLWPQHVWEEALALLRVQRTTDVITIADVKEALGLSRKYIIPILEGMDQRGITKRLGDTRVWLQK